MKIQSLRIIDPKNVALGESVWIFDLMGNLITDATIEGTPDAAAFVVVMHQQEWMLVKQDHVFQPPIILIEGQAVYSDSLLYLEGKPARVETYNRTTQYAYVFWDKAWTWVDAKQLTWVAPEPKPTSGWVNLYEVENEVYPETGQIYPTRDEALSARNMADRAGYLDTVEITWTRDQS